MSIWLLNQPELRKVEGKLFSFLMLASHLVQNEQLKTWASYGGRRAAQWSLLPTGLAAPLGPLPRPGRSHLPHGCLCDPIKWLAPIKGNQQDFKGISGEPLQVTPLQIPSQTYPSNRTSVPQSFQMLMSSPEVSFKRSETFLTVKESCFSFKQLQSLFSNEVILPEK